VTAVIMMLVRRAARTAERTLAAAHEAQRAAAVDRATRADLNEQLRLVHDTALTTLTLVGTGAVPRWSPRLAQRAAEDLAAVESLGSALAGDGPVHLPDILTRVLSGQDVGWSVNVSTAGPVPAPVGAAFAGAVAEAVRNVARHAGVDRAEVSVVPAGAGVRVEVRDRGVGFDPATIPAQRYGVRQSIVDRMASVGGSARVESRSGEGTRWILEWSEPRERP
jgi:hypothetical protein